jgi:hypothetical protein
MFENGTFLMEIKNRNSDFCEQRREMEASLKRSASDADLRAGGDQSAVSEGGLDNGAMTDDQKQEDDRDSSNDSDANMHRQLGLPCVPIGQHFHFAGRQFVRVSLKSARCLAPRCSTLGGKVLSDKGYGKLTMTQHAEACLRKESQPTPAERATSHQAERQLATLLLKMRGFVCLHEKSKLSSNMAFSKVSSLKTCTSTESEASSASYLTAQNWPSKWLGTIMRLSMRRDTTHLWKLWMLA